MKMNIEKKSQGSIVNAFSVDVEGFVESNIQSFHISDKYISRSRENSEIERNTEVLLEVFADKNVRATFFFLGRLANDIPGLVKKVAQAGHEIACHNYSHLRVFGVSKSEFAEKLADSKRRLEDVSGQRVYGFRAPDFSITDKSLWAIDVLKELGFVYDSSIYPIGMHDVYGIKDAKPFIYKFPNGLIEFPLPTVELFGRRFPFGGGGYFRLYPLWLTRLLFAKVNARRQPCMFYIHPYEVGPVIPKISPMSYYRRFRHYYHCRNGQARLRKLLKTCKFRPVIEVLRSCGLFGKG
jgi:polysaccharide deacetylase family protein (PEP-CTERM system associated)